MCMAIFSNINRKKDEFGSTIHLLFPVLLKTLGTWRFATGAQITVKFEQNVAVGDFYSKVKLKIFF